MQNNTKTFLTSFRYLCLIFVFVVGLITITASGGGGGSDDSSGTTDDTTDDTTYTSLYDPDNLPTGTSFSYTDDDATPTTITFDAASIGVSGGAGASVADRVVTISSPGTYNISSDDLQNGQIVVNTADAGDVRLYLDNAKLSYTTSAPIDIESAERVIIVLADGTENSLTDEDSSLAFDGDGEAIDAALYSKEDLVIYGIGTGSLYVNGMYYDGIKSKDGLIIDGGTINVYCHDDGIIGKNYVSIEGGDINVYAWGDGLKSTNDGDTTQGYIYIKDGLFDITTGADAIQVETHIVIENGDFDLFTAEGHLNPVRDLTDVTAKGLKAPVGVTIYDGFFTIDAADDTIHSNDTIVIHGGDFDLASGDDALHGDLAVTVNGGDIHVSTCFEGIESIVITINNGDIHIKSSDDAINASEGLGRTVAQFNCRLYINGGYTVVDGNGDGVDSNTAIAMTNGILIVNGPPAGTGGNGVLDYSSFTMTGGFVIAAGTSGMSLPPGSQTSAQYSLLVNFTSAVTANTLFHIETSSGTDIVTFAPSKNYQSIGFSSPHLATGDYVYNTGGSYAGGTLTDGLYQGGAFSGGTDTSFKISSKVTTIGTSGGGPGGGMPMP